MKRILVVEDEPSISQICQLVLADDGFAVDLAPNGKIAQQMIEQRDFDLFLFDIRMAEMTGIELFQWLQETHPEITKRVAFTTGDTLGWHTQEFISGAGRPLLNKPFTPDELSQFIKKLAENNLRYKN